MTAGSKLKAGNGWDSHQGNSGNGSDNYDFSALPSGGKNNTFGGIGTAAYWWTSTERDKDNAFFSTTTNQSDVIGVIFDFPKQSSFSARCLKGSEF